MHPKSLSNFWGAYHKGVLFLVGTVGICRNPAGGDPSAKRRALPSRERRADNFSFCLSFRSARVVLVLPPTKKDTRNEVNPKV